MGVFKHLAVAGRIAKRCLGTAADHQVDALGLAGVVVVEQKLGLFKTVDGKELARKTIEHSIPLMMTIDETFEAREGRVI